MEVGFKARRRSLSAMVKLLKLAILFPLGVTLSMGQEIFSFQVSLTAMFILRVVAIWQILLGTVLLLTAINMACLNYTTCSQLKGQLGSTDYITAGEIACGTGSVHATAFGVPSAETIGPDTDLSALVDWTFGNKSNFFRIVAENKGATVEQQAPMLKLVHQHHSFAATHATLIDYYDQAIQSNSDGIQRNPADGLLSTARINQIRSQGQFVTPTMEFYRLAFSNPARAPGLSFNASCNYSNIQINVANMHAAGVPIAVGTDSAGSLPGIIN